ncbi:MAG: CRTAC1 family protein [Microthrixaceae bacterium]
MAARPRLLPIAGFVLVLVALVAVRFLAGDDDATTASEASADNADRADGADSADAAVLDGLVFTDVTEQAGLAEPHGGSATGEAAMTAGAAVADVDADGDLDVLLPRVGRPNRLLLNDGDGRFEDASERSGIAGATDSEQGSSAAAFVDVDADGDLDVVVTGAGTAGTSLLVNDGSGVFADGTDGSGLDDLPALPDGRQAQMHGITVADYDRDGRLDLLLTHWDDVIPGALAGAGSEEIRADDRGSTVCPRAGWLAEHGFPRADGSPANRGRLYRNEGDGRFRDVSAAVGLPFHELLGFTGSFADVDGDGWDDLLITGDFCTSRLFRNVDGVRFEDVTTAAGVATDENGMGSVVADLNGDAHPDWFVTSIGPVGDAPAPLSLGGGYGSSGNRAFLNRGDGTFVDATDQLGLRNGGWGWGAAIEDFGNDGRLGVVMTNGYSIGGDEDRTAGAPAVDPMLLWLLDDGRGTEVAAAAGLDDTGLGRALVPFDMDRDGDLDLLVANHGGAPRLYRNDVPRRHWLVVQLDDPTTPGNRRGIGARVTVTPHGGEPVTRWVIGGGSYESQVPAEVHVGLGDVEDVERVEVRWPGDSTGQVVEDVEADRVLVVERAVG